MADWRSLAIHLTIAACFAACDQNVSVPPAPIAKPTPADAAVERAAGAGVAAPPGAVVVRGRLVHHGRALAGLHLELCGEREGNIYWKTPCERAPRRWTAATRDDGSFELAGLPRADFQLFILDFPYHTQTFIASAAQLGPTLRDLGTQEVHSTLDH
jgi:hypothetical protein